MKKTLFLAVLSLILALPALAQRGQRGNERHENRGQERHEQRVQREPRHDDRGRGIERDDRWNGRRQERDFHRDNDRRGYHWSDRREDFRSHWNGRRFDDDFFAAHWGYGHHFRWGHCGWYGPRFYVGSYFWYNGIYFEVIDPIPPYWYDDDVAVIYDPMCDCYYVVNDRYPDVRIHIGIRF